MSEVIFTEAEVDPIVGYRGVVIFDDAEVEPILAEPPEEASAPAPESDATVTSAVDPSPVDAYQGVVVPPTGPRSEGGPDPGYARVIRFDPVHLVGRVARSGPAVVERTTGLTGNHRRLIDQPRIAADAIEPWTVTGVLRMQLERAISDAGTSDYLADYKDRWVRAHRAQIQEAARRSGVPAWVIGGVAWTEVGGDPAWTDSLAETVENRERISYGPVQMELRRAEEELGYPVGDTSRIQQRIIIGTLLDPQLNLQLVGRHLERLKNVDAPAMPWSWLSDEQLAVAISRYNRGPERTVHEMRHTATGTRYGAAVLGRRARTEGLLAE